MTKNHLITIALTSCYYKSMATLIVKFSFSPEEVEREVKRITGNNYTNIMSETNEIINSYMDMNEREEFEINATPNSPKEEIIIKGIRAFVDGWGTAPLRAYLRCIEQAPHLLQGTYFHVHNPTLSDKSVYICCHEH